MWKWYHVIDVEHPVETALKKLKYRGTMLIVRDIFDLAVVDTLFHDALRGQLRHVGHLRSRILNHLSGISEEFLRRELDGLDIVESWRKIADRCLEHVHEIAEAIPAAKAVQ
jgi:hypothetical protein